MLLSYFIITVFVENKHVVVPKKRKDHCNMIICNELPLHMGKQNAYNRMHDNFAWPLFLLHRC